MEIRCTLCPHECRLENYQIGICRARMRLDDKLVTLAWGKACSAHADPVEKKPLFHFVPGSGAFSFAAAGCNLRCTFCQNWGISQAGPETVRSFDLPPDKVVSLAREKNCRSIAYTYSEPSVFFEYMFETASLAREKGLRNIWVTAAYINPEPLRRLAPVMDAANIDIKAFSESFYRDICGGSLKPVLAATELARSLGIWVELTNLLVPTLNDDPAMIRDLCRWTVKTLGPDVPLHFSRFFPEYRLRNLPPTPLSTLNMAAEIAREAGIRHVYTGNVPYDGNSDTRCPTCGETLITRIGYTVTLDRLSGTGRCPRCAAAIPGVWS
jgi:pyruvate formate lyase activating enzyme